MTTGAPTGRRRWVVLALLLGSLVLVQVGLVNFLPTPWAVPDVVTVAVIAVAIAHGPVVGGLAAAGTGLTLDLIPPAAGPLGSWMLVLTLVAVAVGRLNEARDVGPFVAMAAVAIGSGAVVVGQAGIAWFAGAPANVSVLGQAVASAAWALILAPLALVIVTSRQRRPRGAPGGSAASPGALLRIGGRG